jgi:FlaA1/EpsC-like NDP-sugar epimerase
MQNWQGKRVLITGVCGTIGRELLRQVVAAQAAEVVGIDNNESELFFASEEYSNRPHVRFYLADVRDRRSFERKMAGIDIVLHTAAFKHVILCEHSPREAVQTNVNGTQNVIDAALDNNVERMIFTSSDKAVNPTNVMGTSKLMGERLVTAANALRRGKNPIFASTRFGNVLGSRGSVIPLFRRQIANGGPVTLTHPDMTRFIMTLEEAVRLVIDSVFIAQGGEVFVTKMPVVRILDLAHVMVDELAPRYGFDPADIRVDLIGPKAGEKMYEELMNTEETRRVIELEKFYVVAPAFRSVLNDVSYRYDGMLDVGLGEPYNSANAEAMPREAVGPYLKANGLLLDSDKSETAQPLMVAAPNS